MTKSAGHCCHKVGWRDQATAFPIQLRTRGRARLTEKLDLFRPQGFLGRASLTLYPLFSDEGDFASIDIAKERLPDQLTEYEYFIGGPKLMVDGLMRDLKKEGVQRKRIHVEAFEFR